MKGTPARLACFDAREGSAKGASPSCVKGLHVPLPKGDVGASACSSSRRPTPASAPTHTGPMRLNVVILSISTLVLSCSAARAATEVGPMTSRQPLAIRSAKPVHSQVARYGLMELDVALAATYDNPFDPGDVSLWATFRSPSGKATEVAGFLYQAFDRKLDGDREVLAPAGPPRWRVRFCPTETGTYTYTVGARDRTGSVGGPSGSFRAVNGRSRGFLGLRKGAQYLTFSDGEPYIAIGENVCWYTSRGTYDYDRYFQRFRENGMNYTRIWMSPWSVGLEWDPSAPYYGPPTTYLGLGRYSLENAWRLDYILEQASRDGIYVMLCLLCHGENRIHSNDPRQAMWPGNPYSAERGGPCPAPQSFFTNPKARSLFKQRLRYITARWGAFTSVLAWELWNEVDIIERYESAYVAAWHREMAQAVRSMDQYGHPVTSSFANTQGDPNLWQLPEMSFTQAHYYGGDPERAVVDATRGLTERYGKPSLFGEYGVDASGRLQREDPTGVHLHNGLWAGVMSGGLGTAMTWWWDSYVELANLYGHYKALAAFVRGWPWAASQWKPAQVTCPPAAVAVGLQNASRAVLWLRNAESSWRAVQRGVEPSSVPSMELEVTGMADGRYRVEWWDTYKGTPLSTSEAQCKEAKLVFTAPAFARDVACKIRPAVGRQEGR